MILILSQLGVDHLSDSTGLSHISTKKNAIVEGMNIYQLFGCSLATRPFIPMSGFQQEYLFSLREEGLSHIQVCQKMPSSKDALPFYRKRGVLPIHIHIYTILYHFVDKIYPSIILIGIYHQCYIHTFCTAIYVLVIPDLPSYSIK